MAEEVEAAAGCDVCCVNPMKDDMLFGFTKYDYKYMCMPSLMGCIKKSAPAPFFFGKDEKLPLFLSLFLGLQHCIAMVGGIATSGGYLITNDACFDFQYDSEMCARKSWMISIAWLTSGVLTIIQVFRAKIKGTPYFLGTGLISVMGTSFTFLPIARTMTIQGIADARQNACLLDSAGAPIFNGTCCHDPDPTAFSIFGRPDTYVDCKGAGAVGYGKFLGTAAVAALIEIVIAFVPPRIMKKIFPPVVTGAAVMLIGGGLISSGIKYVGGGVFCGENTESKFPWRAGELASGATSGLYGLPQMCEGDNGDVALSFGSPEYVGLGMSVILASILIQMFGSPFMKSTFLFWALMFGCIIATVGKDVDGDGTPESFYRSDYTAAANDKPLTFFWVETGGFFPLGFDGTNFLPILIGYLISTAESIGDVSVTCEYSGVTDEAEMASRIQGGLLADGINSFIACILFGSPPNTTFSQNCGLIPLTKCASRSAGFSCAFWLICLGIFSHFGAAFASIPICVVGGLVLQAFTAVFVSGMKLATQDFSRRNQFILMLSLAVGLGVAMEGHIVDWPGPYSFVRKNLAYDYGFWPEKDVCTKPNAGWIDSVTGTCKGVGFFSNGINNGNCCSEFDDGKRMLRKTVLMICKTPYAIGFFFAFTLNLILPEDEDAATGSAPAATKTAEA